ncbi:hypothetical protein [Poseidonocella sp. HB161398]|uniref:hypothetical protein n=1 Tax=Poseidonocella sp. HB161398 TaxID=2320855 RepID=UPI0011087578|nr:hypothetical protein [Poseidonocella sp. HB161398]
MACCQFSSVFFQEQARNQSRTDQEVETVLIAELKRLGAIGIKRVVWSNEAFLARPGSVLPILRNLAALGVEIIPIAYVRRHDSWAQSGYVQFGIKSKPYHGPLRGFEQWVQEHDISYAENLRIWLNSFSNLEIYNFDSIDNVAEHFISFQELGHLTSM